MRNRETIQKDQSEVINLFRILFMSNAQDNYNKTPSTKNTYLMFHLKNTYI